MLSGECAAGKYPVQSVATMAAIVSETEQHINYEKRFRKTDFKINSLLDAISHATCGMAIDIGAKCIVVSSLSGRTVRMVSRFRVPMDIIGMATNKRVWYKLALSWGVHPGAERAVQVHRRPVLPCAARRPADAPAPRRATRSS